MSSLMIPDREIGGARVLRTFRYHGELLRPGRRLTSDEVLAIPIKNRRTLVADGFLKICPIAGGRGAAVTEPLPPAADDDLATAILDQLQGGRKIWNKGEEQWMRPFISLKDPRHPEARTIPLEAYARAEIDRSFARGRMRKAPWPANVPRVQVPNATDIRRARQALSKFLFNAKCRAAHDWLGTIRIEPPPKADVGKWWCACEAFDLIEQFSQKLPSGTGRSDKETGAFQTIAALLYEAVYGVPEENMQRACAAVLHARQATLRGVPRDPTTGARRCTRRR